MSLTLDGSVPRPFLRFKNVNLRLGEANCRVEPGNKLVIDAVLPDQPPSEWERRRGLHGLGSRETLTLLFAEDGVSVEGGVFQRQAEGPVSVYASQRVSATVCEEISGGGMAVGAVVGDGPEEEDMESEEERALREGAAARALAGAAEGGNAESSDAEDDFAEDDFDFEEGDVEAHINAQLAEMDRFVAELELEEGEVADVPNASGPRRAATGRRNRRRGRARRAPAAAGRAQQNGEQPADADQPPDDLDVLLSLQPKVTRIRVWSGTLIYKMELTLTNGVIKKYGRGWGGGARREPFNLERDEWLVSIQQRAGDFLDWVQFTTNKNRRVQYGNAREGERVPDLRADDGHRGRSFPGITALVMDGAREGGENAAGTEYCARIVGVNEPEHDVEGRRNGRSVTQVERDYMPGMMNEGGSVGEETPSVGTAGALVPNILVGGIGRPLESMAQAFSRMFNPLRRRRQQDQESYSDVSGSSSDSDLGLGFFLCCNKVKRFPCSGPMIHANTTPLASPPPTSSPHLPPSSLPHILSLLLVPPSPLRGPP